MTRQRSKSKSFDIDRAAATVAAAVCLGTLVFLLIRNKPFEDPNLAIFARGFMSLSMAVLGATIPGFLNVAWEGNGAKIRAGGALALFLITYFGTPYVAPTVLGEAEVQLLTPTSVDIRTREGHNASYEARLQAKGVLIVPMTYRNVVQPAKTATIESEKAELSFAQETYNFSWEYFVNMHPERFGDWLAIENSVRSTAVEAGQSVYHETLFSNSNSPTWQQIVDAILATSATTAQITANATVDGRPMSVQCQIDLRYWQDQIRLYIENNQLYPMRVTMSCINATI